MTSLYPRSGGYQVSFWYTDPVTGERQRFRQQSPYPNKRQSREWAFQKKIELEKPPESPGIEAIEFGDLIDIWREKYAAVNYKPSTRKGQNYMIAAHIKPAFEGMKAHEIGALELDSYIAARLDEVSAKTVRNELAVISSVLRKGKRWGFVEELVEIDWPSSPPPEWTYLEVEELERLIEAAKSEYYLEQLVPFLVHTGARLGEALALRWDRIDFKRKRVTIDRSYSTGHTTSPKSNKARQVPLNKDAVAALEAQKSSSYMRGGLVWTTREGEQVTKNHLNKSWYRTIRKAGIRYVRIHDLRHTFASHLVQRGVSLQVVKELLGHGQISTTLRYAHLAPQNLASAVEVLEQTGTKLEQDSPSDGRGADSMRVK